INTHLESGISASSSGLRRDQAYELIEDTSVMSKPLILLGDLNSPAPGGVVYNALLSSGFTDAWQGGSPSNTCCQNPDLLNPTSQLFERIDFILYKPQYHTAIRRIDSYISGFDPGDKTVSGLWPSDHASVVFIFDLYR
ncbi:MAG: endonuclease/exonuclease/phosphatase family protein, partial [Spirochaetota bacterium]|nr:endonuclease/exonuclease/phosphatase family protein [Spirochaetota bacterium]